MDWFLYDNGLRYERLEKFTLSIFIPFSWNVLLHITEGYSLISVSLDIFSNITSTLDFSPCSNGVRKIPKWGINFPSI